MNTQAKTPNGSDRLTVDGWTASTPRRWKHEWISESPHKAGSLDVAPYSSSNASPAHALAAHGDPFAEGQISHVAPQMVSHDGWTVKSDMPSEPPNYRPAAKRLNAPHCGSCKMFNDGKCWGYGNKPVEEDYVCDSYSPSDNSHQDQADNPTDGKEQVDSTTSSFAGDLDWNLTVFDDSSSESGWHFAAEKDELFIALNVPKPTADEIYAWAKEQDWPEGTELEEPSEYHITLLYSPKGHEEHKEAEWWATDNSDSVHVDGLEAFPSQEREELDAFVLRVDTADGEIKARMERLLDAAEDEGVEVNRYDGGSKPHITVAYGPKLPKGIKPLELSFSTDEAHCGNPRTSSVFDGPSNDASHEKSASPIKHSPPATSDHGDSEQRANDTSGKTAKDDASNSTSWARWPNVHASDEDMGDGTGWRELSHDFRLADYNVQVPVVTPNQGVGLATPHQVGDLLSIQSVAHNLHYKYQQSGLDPTSAQQYASKLLQAIGYTSPDQPTIDAALQAWKAMYPEDARSAYALPGVATSSHDADSSLGDAALDWTDSHAASTTDSETKGLALLEFGGLSGRDSDAAANGEHDSSLGWHEPRVAQTMYHWAPRQHREQIAQEGLRAALPEGDEYVDYNNPDAYKGVYLFNNPPTYTPGGSKGFYGDDLWSVDTSGLPVQPDEGEFDASMIPHDIDPSRIQFLNSPAHRKAWEQFDQERYGKKRPKVRKTEKPQKCKECKQPATKSLIWAEGAAYVPVCDKHEDKVRKHLGEDEVCAVHTIRKKAGSPQTIFQPIRAIVDQVGQVHTFNDGHVPYSTSNGIDPATNQAHLQIHQPSGEVEDLSGAHSAYEQQVADHLNTQTGEQRYHPRPNDMDWVFGSAGGASQNMPITSAHETPCQTPGAVYDTSITDSSVTLSVELPGTLDLDEDAAKHLEDNLHNAVELVLATQWGDIQALGAKTLSNPSRQPVTQARTHEESASTSAEESQGGSPSIELSHFLHVADSWDTRQWPDPLSDNGTGGNVPRGCTCQSGHKLDCPIHGLEANGEYDTMEWTIPEASPVGYPQDQPRNWQQAESSIATSPTVRDDIHQDDEAKTNSQANEHRAKQRTNHGTEGNEYEWHQVHAPSIAEQDSQAPLSTALAHTEASVNSRPSYKALLVPSGLRQSIEIVGSDNDLEWYSSPYSSYDLSHQKSSGPISDGTSKPGVTVEEVDAPSPLATNDPWNESFRDRRPLLYHVPTGRVLMGPPGSEHGSLYNHLGRSNPEWLPEEVHEGIIGKGGVKFFDDNSSNPEGYPQEAADAVVHHTGIAEDPEVDKEYGWDFNGSHLGAVQVVNVPGNQDFDFQGRVPLIAHGDNIYAGANGETHDALKARLGDRLQGVHPNDLAHGGMFVDSHSSEYGITPGSYEWFDTNFAPTGSGHNQAVEEEIRRRGLEPINMDEQWKFSKVAGISVHEVGEPTDSGTEWHGTRRPFTYFPNEQDLILGAPGADHAAMLYADPKIFQKYRRKQHEDDTAAGGVYNDAQGNKVVEYYYGTPEDEHVQAVQNALGAQRSQLNEWHVGDDVHDNPDKTWDFNSKVGEIEGEEWEPGTPGKGIRFPNGETHVWPTSTDEFGIEGYPHHTEHLEDMGMEPYHPISGELDEKMMDQLHTFDVRPDGTVDNWHPDLAHIPGLKEPSHQWDFNSALRGAQEGPTGDELRQIEDSQPQERQGLIPLTWEPGLHGKGLYFPSTDKLTTWSDPRHHSDVWYDDEHYPEPGVAHHLDIQPNGQYVDQGAFNRDMENNNEGLDEGELAQAIQRHEPRLTDRDPGHEWSFSKVATLAWQPGSFGKGLIHEGEVHTWPTSGEDGEPSHPEYASAHLALPEGEDAYLHSPTWDTAFEIDPHGRVNAYDSDRAEEIGQQVESADPRLKLNYNRDYHWDFGSTEPQKMEPDMDEHGNLHGVQFTNDSPGVATVDA